MIMSSVNTTVGDGVIGQSINGLFCKHDLSSILTFKKRARQGGTVYNPNPGETEIGGSLGLTGHLA